MAHSLKDCTHLVSCFIAMIHTQVILISRYFDIAIFHRLQTDTTRFIDMPASMVAALVQSFPEFSREVRQCMLLGIYHAKLLYTRCTKTKPAPGKRNHLCKRSRM